MGKRLQRRTYVLHFGEGTYLDGAEIRIRSTPISVVDELDELRFSESVPLFLSYLESWNLEDADGEPIKLTEQAIRDELELSVLKEIITEWIRAAIGVTAPLDPPSSSGQESPDMVNMELSIPMVPLSENQQN